MSDQSIVTSLEEARGVAGEMAKAYRQLTAYYREQAKLSPEEAEAQATPETDDDIRGRVFSKDLQLVNWWDFSKLAEVDDEAAHTLWEQIRADAHDELVSGHRAAKVLEFDDAPWKRAQFLALRSTLCEDWKPNGAIERLLIDTLTLSYTGQLNWLARLHHEETFESVRQHGDVGRRGKWVTPTVSSVEAMEQSAAMVERFNRLFIRSLRALRDLRRYAGPVVVQNAGQVNVGAQQINVVE